MVKKKITLEQLAAQMQKGFASVEVNMEKGFAAVADDMADTRRDMATKDQMFALQVQVNSIEGQLKETRTEVRLGNLEEKVFGAPRR